MAVAGRERCDGNAAMPDPITGAHSMGERQTPPSLSHCPPIHLDVKLNSYYKVCYQRLQKKRVRDKRETGGQANKKDREKEGVERHRHMLKIRRRDEVRDRRRGKRNKEKKDRWRQRWVRELPG